MTTTPDNVRPAPRPAQQRRRRLGVISAAVLVCALLAFALLPTGHLNSRSLVQINGSVFAVPAGARATIVAELIASPLRSGSTLDLTGNVISIGDGAAPTREIDSRPLDHDVALTDGSRVVVRHGSSVLEGLVRTTKTIPFETVVQGSGDGAEKVKEGSEGTRAVYTGAVSRTQGFAVVLEPAQNAVVPKGAAGGSGQKLVALTFDDGPGKYTPAVLDALAAKRAPATFFVLGPGAKARPDLIKRMKAEGHLVANHGWTHKPLTTLSEAEIRSEISRTDDVIGGSRYVRPAYGARNEKVKAVIASMGMKLAMWNVDTRDWEKPDVDAIMGWVKKQTRPNGIIIMHDGGSNRSATVAAIPVIVDWLRANGYTLVTIDKIL
jgi:peptidoglycan/xylan/chitin deacetylase (PgdA/CDA1 family)